MMPFFANAVELWGKPLEVHGWYQDRFSATWPEYEEQVCWPQGPPFGRTPALGETYYILDIGLRIDYGYLCEIRRYLAVDSCRDNVSAYLRKIEDLPLMYKSTVIKSKRYIRVRRKTPL